MILQRLAEKMIWREGFNHQQKPKNLRTSKPYASEHLDLADYRPVEQGLKVYESRCQTSARVDYVDALGQYPLVWIFEGSFCMSLELAGVPSPP
jgi:hypothetical protein